MYDFEGEPLNQEDMRLFGRYQRPLPEYALAVEYAKISPEERKRRITELKQKVRDGVVRIQQSDEFRQYLITMSLFHDYSWHNQLLIMIQRPDATLVRGFQGWKDLGRYVKKGEAGIRILAPSGPTSETQWIRATDGATWVIRKTNGQWGAYRHDKIDKPFKTSRQAAQWLRDQGAVPKKEVIAVNRFVDVAVFDIKQTEGKPLPEFVVPVLTGAMNRELFDAMLALMQKQGVTVSFEARPSMSPEIKGQFMPPNAIWVRPEEAPAQQLKTLLHEAAHYYAAGPFQVPRQDAETIAESAAFVIAAHHGFDTGVRSFPYVALWARDEKTLDKNLEAVHKVSEHIIEELEDLEGKTLLRPGEPVKQEPKPVAAGRMTLQEMESSYSTEQIKQMAREKSLSTAGSKRDIIKRLIG